MPAAAMRRLVPAIRRKTAGPISTKIPARVNFAAKQQSFAKLI
jgi:hypothetical protein